MVAQACGALGKKKNQMGDPIQKITTAKKELEVWLN
jgi:hypothetical protein